MIFCVILLFSLVFVSSLTTPEHLILQKVLSTFKEKGASCATLITDSTFDNIYQTDLVHDFPIITMSLEKPTGKPYFKTNEFFCSYYFIASESAEKIDQFLTENPNLSPKQAALYAIYITEGKPDVIFDAKFFINIVNLVVFAQSDNFFELFEKTLCLNGKLVNRKLVHFWPKDKFKDIHDVNLFDKSKMNILDCLTLRVCSFNFPPHTYYDSNTKIFAGYEVHMESHVK